MQLLYAQKRRVSAESSIDKDELEEDTSVPKTINEQTNTQVESPDVLDSEPSDIQESHKTDEQINNDDDNLSNIDLARALIESGEKEKAKEIILNIIKTGSADQAHEARILNLQIVDENSSSVEYWKKYFGWQQQNHSSTNTVQYFVDKSISKIADHKIKTVARGEQIQA